MEQVMIDGKLITKGETFMDPHAPDDYVKSETELTTEDIVNIVGGTVISEYDPDSAFLGTESYVPRQLSDNDKPVIPNGDYKVSVISIERRNGISKGKGKPYDGITLKAKVVCDENGFDTFSNLRVEQYFYLLGYEYKDFKSGEMVTVTKEDQIKKLKDAMFTADIDVDYTNSITVNSSLANYDGKEIWMNVKAKKKDGKVVKNDGGWPEYNAKIIPAPTYDVPVVVGSYEQDMNAPF